MLEVIKKGLEAALGGLSVTQEKMKEIADELVVRGHLTKKEGADLVKSLKETAKESQRKVGGMIEEQVRKALKEIGVASSSDVKALKGRIEKLEKLLSAGEKKTEKQEKAKKSGGKKKVVKTKAVEKPKAKKK